MNQKQVVWHAGLSLSIAVIIAICVNYYFLRQEEIWVLMSVVASALITRGKPFRQGVACALTMVLAVGLAGLLAVDKAIGIYIVVPITFFIAGNVIAPLTYLYLLLFILALMVPGHSDMLIRDRMMNVGLGSIIGYLAGQAIFPINIPMLFKQNLLPILEGMSSYLKSIAGRIKMYHDPEDKVEIAESKIEYVLSGSQGMYPEWVYEAGFNPGLRSGFRFFLIRLEHIIELMMAVNCIAKRINYHHIPDDVLLAIEDCLATNDILLQSIFAYLSTGELVNDDNYDYKRDIDQFNKAVSAVMPDNLELLDLSEQYIHLAALLYAVKDMRKTLLELGLSIKPSTTNLE